MFHGFLFPKFWFFGSPKTPKFTWKKPSPSTQKPCGHSCAFSVAFFWTLLRYSICLVCHWWKSFCQAAHLVLNHLSFSSGLSMVTLKKRENSKNGFSDAKSWFFDVFRTDDQWIQWWFSWCPWAPNALGCEPPGTRTRPGYDEPNSYFFQPWPIEIVDLGMWILDLPSGYVTK